MKTKITPFVPHSCGQKTPKSPGSNLNSLIFNPPRTILISLLVLFLSGPLLAQTIELPDAGSCTSKDLELVGASLPPNEGEDICACGGTRTLMLSIANKTGSTRTSFALWGTLKVFDSEGNLKSSENIFACAGPIPKSSTTTLASNKTISYTCGESIKITDLFLAWTAASPKETCDVLEANPSKIAPKCGTLPEIQVVANVDAGMKLKDAVCTANGDIGEAVVTPFGGQAPYKVKIGLDERTNITTSTTFVDLPIGSYNVLITDNRNCAITKPIVIKSPPLVTVDAGNDFLKTCISKSDGDFIGEENDSDYTYAWVPTTGLNDATISKPMANPSATTKYTLTKTHVASGCSNTDEVTVSVNKPIVTAAAGTDFTMDCDKNINGSSIGEQNNNDYTYAWLPTTGLSNATISNPTANPSNTTTYTVNKTHIASGCSATDDVLVTVNNPTVTAAAGTDFTMDCDKNINGSSIGEQNNNDYTYAWLPTTGLSNATISNPTANPSNTTTYTVTKTHIASGCSDTDDVIVTVNNPIVTAIAGTDFTIDCDKNINGSSIGEQNNSDFSYSWLPATGLSNANISNPTANPSNTTTYTVTKTHITSGCSDTDDVIVSVNNDNVPAPSLCVVQPSLCGPEKGSVTITSPIGNDYEYSIDNGATWQTGVLFDNLAAGSVTGVKVKNSISGCISSAANCSISDCTPQEMVGAESQVLLISSPKQTSLKAYPNPFSDSVNFIIDVAEEGDGNLDLINLQGQKVLSIHAGKFKAGKNTFTANLNTRGMGMLIYVLKVGNEKITGKLIQSR